MAASSRGAPNAAAVSRPAPSSLAVGNQRGIPLPDRLEQGHDSVGGVALTGRGSLVQHPDLLASLVMGQLRRRELDVRAESEQLASTSGDDRRSVLLGGGASAMDHDAQPRQPGGQLPGELVQRHRR
jgi:hypothetical protein